IPPYRCCSNRNTTGPRRRAQSVSPENCTCALRDSPEPGHGTGCYNMIYNAPPGLEVKRVIATGLRVPLDESDLARQRNARWRENNRGRERERQRSPEYRAQRCARDKSNPGSVKRAEQRRNINKNHRPIIAIDTEGMDFPGEDIVTRRKIKN